jgi:RNA polymerase sigma-70 factor (ECF subfamily)
MTFRELYDAEFPFVWRTLRRLGVRDADVDDAAQEVFMIVHRRLPEFEGRARVTTWLFRICYHVARDRSRLASARREVVDGSISELVADDAPSVESTLEHERDLRLLDTLLGSLEFDQRAVFTLFELEQLTGEAIAETLQIPLGTVYSRLRLAREAFRAAARRELARQRHPRPMERRQ